jgi:hypothetical protein
MMADNIDNLALEQWRKLREQSEQILDAVRYIHTQQLADRLSTRSLHVSLDNTNDLLMSLAGRVGRIEKRLELTDQAAFPGFGERRPTAFEKG